MRTTGRRQTHERRCERIIVERAHEPHRHAARAVGHGGHAHEVDRTGPLRAQRIGRGVELLLRERRDEHQPHRVRATRDVPCRAHG